MSNRMREVCKPIKRYVIFPHGVDFEKYFPVDDPRQARQKVGWPENKKIILFPANPSRPVKNFPLAKKAVALLCDDSVELKAFVNVPDEHMNLYYNAADVLLMTSTHEGSPCVIKEAMACNLPVVSTDVGDVREITSDTAGCAVCSPNPKELAAAVTSVLKNGQRTTGRDQVSYLEISSVIQKQIKLYEEVLYCG